MHSIQVSLYVNVQMKGLAIMGKYVNKNRYVIRMLEGTDYQRLLGARIHCIL
jgi:hypothetical protein